MILNKNRNWTFVFHGLVWLVLFSFPYLLSSGQDQVLKKVVLHSWIPLAMYAFIFYLNYLWLIDKFIFNKRIGVFILVNIFLIIFCIYVRDLINSTFFRSLIPVLEEGKGPPLKFFIYLQIISFLVPIVFSVLLKMADNYIKSEAERKEAANAKLSSELQHLKYQLQPHFFFNSLNNIYSLVDISPERAKSTIHSLSKLMRYLLYETNTEKVSLKEEIQFMEKYIELMKLRLTDKTKVEYQFPEVSIDLKVAPLLFISLIENAFKHGVSANQESSISFEMTVRENIISFKTQNFNFPKADTDKSGSGIGLENLCKRLELLYPGKYEFHKYLKDSIFIAELNIHV